MSDDLVIDLSIDGLEDAAREAQDFAKEMQDAYAPTREIQKAVRGIRADLHQATTDMMLFARSAQLAAHAMGRTAAPRTAGARGRSAGGPAASLAAAQARAGLNPGDFDAQYALHQANRRYTRAQQQMRGNDIGQQLKQLVMSTRIGIGPNGVSVMPLIGALGKSGPLSIAVSAAAAGIALLAKAAADGARTMKALSEARWMTGGSWREVETLRKAAGFLGVTPEQMGAGPSTLANKLGSDSYAMMAGAKIGISNPLGGTPLGKANVLPDYIKAMRAISMMKNDMEAIRTARALGMENVLPIRDLDPSSRKEMLNQIEASMSPERARLQAAIRYRESGFQQWKENLGMSAMDSAHAGGFAAGRALRALMGANSEAKQGMTGGAAEQQMRDQLNKTDKVLRSQRSLEDAIRGNTASLDQMSVFLNRGLHGGGERARGAIPRAMQGTIAYQEGFVLRQAATLGAFAL